MVDDDLLILCVCFITDGCSVLKAVLEAEYWLTCASFSIPAWSLYASLRRTVVGHLSRCMVSHSCGTYHQDLQAGIDLICCRCESGKCGSEIWFWT